MNREEKKQYMKVWYQENKGRVLKKQQKIRDDAKIVSTLEKNEVEIASEIVSLKNSVAFYKAVNNNRAKEITNLKKENKQLKSVAEFQQSSNMKRYFEIKELEQENNKLLDVINNQDVKIADLEKENAELKERYDKVDIIGYDALKNLTKAKEIIKTVLDKWEEERWILQSEEEVRQIEKLMKQAKQFLKEIK